ncbi:MAG: pyridoxal-phosphate dependent enzyme, partial [Actinobacteria bacterium]
KLIAIQPYPQGGLAGLRNMSEGFVPSILDLTLIDENIIVKDIEAFQATRKLLEVEGIFAGISSGAAALEAVKLAERINKGTIVTVFPDNGWKYLSQEIWSKPPEEISEGYSGPLW